MFDPSGKFKVLDQPYALPCKCVGCGIGHNDDGKRQFIDTGLELDFYGVIYICSSCFVEMAAAFDFVPYEDYRTMRDSSSEFEIEARGLVIENDALRTAVGLLSEHRCFKSAAVFDGLLAKGSTKDKDSPGEPIEAGVVPRPDIVEPGDDEGLSDVRGTAKLDKPKPAAKPDTIADLL